MIGMMNGGNSNDVPVEFYSSRQRSSIYELRSRRENYPNIENSRILLNGNPKPQHSPEELWQELLLRMVFQTAYKRNLERGRSGKSKVRRFFDHFSVQPNDPPTIAVVETKRKKLQTSSGKSTSQQPPLTTSHSSGSTSAPYITTIVVQEADEKA